MPQTVVIIGYGAAAVNALIALRASGYEGRVRIFTDDSLEQPYSPILTSYYAGGLIAYEGAFPFADLDLASLGAEVACETPVTGIDPARHVVITPLEEIAYDKCLIASGAHPSTLGFPEVVGRSPLVLRTMRDAELLRASLERPECKRVLVSGTSMVALKATEACLARGAQVTLLGRSAHILTRSALPEVAAEFESALADKGVELRISQTAESAQLVDGGFEVAFSDGSSQRFDEVVVAHGMRPALEFVALGALATDAGLVVDDFMRTSDPDIYAAGDVAQVRDRITGETHVAGLWKDACVQGACAGRAMAAELAGGPVPDDARYPDCILSNSISVGEATLVSGGSVALGENRTAEVAWHDDRIVGCVYEGERLVGYCAFSRNGAPGTPIFDEGAMFYKRIVNSLP